MWIKHTTWKHNKFNLTQKTSTTILKTLAGKIKNSLKSSQFVEWTKVIV